MLSALLYIGVNLTALCKSQLRTKVVCPSTDSANSVCSDQYRMKKQMNEPTHLSRNETSLPKDRKLS